MKISYQIKASANYRDDNYMDVPDKIAAMGEDAVENYVWVNMCPEFAEEGLEDIVLNEKATLDLSVDFDDKQNQGEQ